MPTEVALTRPRRGEKTKVMMAAKWSCFVYCGNCGVWPLGAQQLRQRGCSGNSASSAGQMGSLPTSHFRTERNIVSAARSLYSAPKNVIARSLSPSAPLESTLRAEPKTPPAGWRRGRDSRLPKLPAAGVTTARTNRCGMAPAVVLDHSVTGHQTPEKLLLQLKGWLNRGSVGSESDCPARA